MDQKDPALLNDIELDSELSQLRIFAVTNGLFIGFLLGVVAYSLYNRSFGLLMLIPLYFVYRMANSTKSRRLNALRQEQKIRRKR